MRVKEMFFDRLKVIELVNEATRKVLSRAGAYIRQVAKTSIRKRKGTSPPGKPPYSHEGSLRKLMFFSYERDTDSVVIGPLGFRRSNALHVLEYGGWTARPKWWRSKKDASGRIYIRKRPYMGPALQKELPKLPKRWANSVRG